MRNLNKDVGNKRYWLFVTNNENWKIIRENEIYGFNERTQRDMTKLGIGDFVVIYIKGKQIGGLFEITTFDIKTDVKFKEQDYPYKIKLSKILLPKNPVDFTEEMINNISIFKNQKRWGTILMGRATKEITKQDYEYFKEMLNGTE